MRVIMIFNTTKAFLTEASQSSLQKKLMDDYLDEETEA